MRQTLQINSHKHRNVLDDEMSILLCRKCSDASNDDVNVQLVCRCCAQRHAGGFKLCQRRLGRIWLHLDRRRTTTTLYTTAHLPLH